MNDSNAPDSRLIDEKESARQQNVSNDPGHNAQQQAQRAWATQEAATDASSGQREARANAEQAGVPAETRLPGAASTALPQPVQPGIQTGRGPNDAPTR